MKTHLIISLLIIINFLSACTPFMAKTNEGAIKEDYSARTFGTVIEDNSIESKAAINIPLIDPKIADARLVFNSFNRVLLITGQISDKSLKKRVTQTAEKIRNVRRVHNELEISKPISFRTRTKDSYLKTKIKSRLIVTEGVNSGNVEVIVENAKVYLMGLVTHKEADRVVNAVQQVSGLEKIVRGFEYIDEKAGI